VPDTGVPAVAFTRQPRAVSEESDERARLERAQHAANEQFEASIFARFGEVERALADVAPEDALDILKALVRKVTLMSAMQQLRDAEAPDVAEPTGEGDDAELADPWRSSKDPASNTLYDASVLFDALADQGSVAELLRAVQALDADESRSPRACRSI
jgi:hypothetical protein